MTESKRKNEKFDGALKTVLEFKAQLIAAKSVEKKKKSFGSDLISARILKNIQPISVGV
jgi:hypothetical protein